MRSDLNLYALEQFVALARTRNFTRAAEELHVSQPALSRSIRKLEDQLGKPLFERRPREVVLTELGERLLERAREILRMIDETLTEFSEAGRNPRIRLGAIPTIAPFLLPRALKLLRTTFPDLRLSLREEVSSRLVEALRMRTLDAALIALPYEAVGIETEIIADDEFLLVTPPGHPLATRDHLAPSDLAGEDLLLLEDGHCLREHALSVCDLPQSRAAAEVGATSLHTLVQMVAGGLGLTLLPKIAADGGAAQGANVKMRSFDKPVMGRAIGIAWRAGSSRREEARLIAETLRLPAGPAGSAGA